MNIAQLLQEKLNAQSSPVDELKRELFKAANKVKAEEDAYAINKILGPIINHLPDDQKRMLIFHTTVQDYHSSPYITISLPDHKPIKIWRGSYIKVDVRHVTKGWFGDKVEIIETTFHDLIEALEAAKE